MPTAAMGQVTPPGGPDGAISKPYVVPINQSIGTTAAVPGRGTVRITRPSGSSVVFPGNRVIKRSATSATVAAAPGAAVVPAGGAKPVRVQNVSVSSASYRGPSCELQMWMDISGWPAVIRDDPLALEDLVKGLNGPWNQNIFPLLPTPNEILVLRVLPGSTGTSSRYLVLQMVVRGSCAGNSVNAAVSGEGLVQTANFNDWWNSFGHTLVMKFAGEAAGMIAAAAVIGAGYVFFGPAAALSNRALAFVAGCVGSFVTEAWDRFVDGKAWSWAEATGACVAKGLMGVGLQAVVDRFVTQTWPAIIRSTSAVFARNPSFARAGAWLTEQLRALGGWIRRSTNVGTGANVAVMELEPDTSGFLDRAWDFMGEEAVGSCVYKRLLGWGENPVAWSPECEALSQR